jgi:hypothetical protein
MPLDIGLIHFFQSTGLKRTDCLVNRLSLSEKDSYASGVKCLKGIRANVTGDHCVYSEIGYILPCLNARTLSRIQINSIVV